MKKQFIPAVLICLGAVLSLLFFSCSDVFAPPHIAGSEDEGGIGNVTVFFSTGAGRAALSPVTMNFDSYEFIFHQEGKELPDPAIIRTNGQGFSFNLESGAQYTLAVKAYTGTALEPVLAAIGSTDPLEPFTVEDDTQVRVDLKGQLSGGGEGTFSWDFSYPAGTLIDEMHLYIDDENTIALDYEKGITSTAGSKTGIPAGRYFLVVRMSRLNGESAGYANGVEIYPGQETVFTKNFEGEFKDPNIENAPLSVTTWFGFNISGDNGVYTEPGNPTGTLFKTYKDNTGTYKDVLRLVPPSNGYKMCSVALTYKVPIDGYYTLSMWVFAEKRSGDNKSVYISFENTDDPWDRVAGSVTDPIEFGKWVQVKTVLKSEAFLEKGTIFGLLTRDDVRNDWNPKDLFGLNSHTVYLRDPTLEVTTKDGLYRYPLIGSTATPGVLMLTPESLGIYTKDSWQLVLSGDITQGDPVWTSSDPSVVTVDQRGKITATMKEGSSTITVQAGSLSAEATVQVLPKLITLTFDDGPDHDLTPILLDHLKNAPGGPVHATFFLVGNRANYGANPGDDYDNRPIVKRMIAEGHDIGNHTLDHSPVFFDYGDTHYKEQTLSVYKNNLIQAQKDIADALGTGKAPRFFRPSYLSPSTNLGRAAAELGLPRVAGELLSDWETWATPELISDTAMLKAKPWGILIFHDYYKGKPTYIEDGATWVGNGEKTVAAIPDVIERLRADGYEILSVSEIIERKNAILKLGSTEDDMYWNFYKTPSETSPVILASDLTVSQAAVTIKRNNNQTVTASLAPSNASSKTVYWCSASESIATVTGSGTNSATGTISAKAVGTTTVYALSGGRIAQVTVTVTN